MLAVKPDWVAIDWKHPQMSIWLMRANGDVLDHQRHGVDAVAKLDAFTDILKATFGAPVPVVLGGFTDAPGQLPKTTPCSPPALSEAYRLEKDGFTIHLLPAIVQKSPPARLDTVAQVAGFLVGTPEFDGVLCLVGADTHWVHISAGEVVSFRSFMTGALVDFMATHADLCNATTNPAWHTFDEALSDAISRPADLAARLAETRADHVLNGTSGAVIHARLLATLIGAELAAAKPYWLGREVVVIADDAAGGPYARALSLQGIEAQTEDADAMALAGLVATYQTGL